MINLFPFHFVCVWFRFQPSGDHLPVAPPAPAHAQLAAVQAAQYNQAAKHYDSNGNPNVIDENGYETGEYDPRYNDPNFAGHGRSHAPQPTYTQPAQQPQYQVQPQPQAQPQQPQYNYNNENVNYGATYQTTTPYPHRFQPPGKSTIGRYCNFARIDFRFLIRWCPLRTKHQIFRFLFRR